MKKNYLKKQFSLKVSLALLLSFGCLIAVNGQTKQAINESVDDNTTPITACEQWISRLGEALIQWEKNKDASFIVISRLSDSETSRRINVKRIKTLKDYILVPRWKVKAVFAEGERITGDGGVIEIYVEGKLIDTLRVQPKSDIPLRNCNP